MTSTPPGTLTFKKNVVRIAGEPTYVVARPSGVQNVQILRSSPHQGNVQLLTVQSLFNSTFTHTWTVEDFDTVEAKGEDVITSPITTESGQSTWYMVLKPNGKNIAKDTISLFLYLSPTSTFHEVFANFNAYILNDEGEKISWKSIQAQQFIAKPIGKPGVRGWGWKDFLTKDEHFRTNILSDNKLKMYFELEVSPKRDYLLNLCYQKSLRSDDHQCNLSENFASLLETEAFSDVVLSTKGKDFPAHKLILAARSKVFAAMFQHDMRENRVNRVIMEYMSEEVVGEMLRFIYTGKCKTLEELSGKFVSGGTCDRLEKLAEGLLAAADKYDLDRLKIICSKTLCKALSVGNASNMLLLADTHNAKDLKSDAIEFIVSRSSDVFSTTGWKNLLTKGQLIDEVFQSMSRRLASYQAEETS